MPKSFIVFDNNRKPYGTQGRSADFYSATQFEDAKRLARLLKGYVLSTDDAPRLADGRVDVEKLNASGHCVAAFN